MEDTGVIQNFQHYIRLMMLLDSGCQTLRKMFKSRYQDLTGEEWKDNPKCGHQFIQNYAKLLYDKSFPGQKEMLEAGDVKKWDVSLLSSILTRIDMVSSSASQEEWTRISVENQNISDLSQVRNKHAHLPEKSLSKSEFTKLWGIAYTALQELGADEKEIKNLQSCNNISGIEFQNSNTTTTTLSEEEEDAKYKELRCQGNDAVKSKDFEKAILLYTKALQLSTLSDVNKSLLYSNRSYATLMGIERGETPDEVTHQCTLAEEDAKMAISTRPLWFKGYFRQGKVYQRQRKWEMAIRAFNQSLALSPGEDEVKNARDECRHEEAKVISKVNLKPNSLPRSMAEEVELTQRERGITLDAADLRKKFTDMCDSQDPKVASIGWIFMGDRNKNGIDLPLNLEMAAKLYGKAAAAGNPEGMYKLGMMYQNGEGVPVDMDEAVRLFEKAATVPLPKPGSLDRTLFGISSAQYYLGRCYFNGAGKPKDYFQAIRWYEKAVANGCEAAAHSLGHLYAYGIGIEKNVERGIQYWKLAAQKGYSLSMDSLMRIYLVLCEPDEAERWLKAAVNANYLSTIMIQKDVEEKIRKLRETVREAKESLRLKGKVTRKEMEEGIAEKYPEVAVLVDKLKSLPNRSLETPVTYYISPSDSDWEDNILVKYHKHSAEIDRMANNGDKFAENVSSAVIHYMNVYEGIDLLKKVDIDVDQTMSKVIIKEFASAVRNCHQIVMLTPDIMDSMRMIVTPVIVNKMKVKSNLDKDARVCNSMLLHHDVTEAVDFLSVCRKKYPEDSFFLHTYCDMLCYVRKFDEGLQVANEGLRLFPNDPEFLYSRAGHLKLVMLFGKDKDKKNGKVKRKKRDELKEAYLKFIEFAPKSHRMIPEAYYNVAGLWVKFSLLKQDEESEKEFTKYFELGLKAEKNVLPCFLPLDKCQTKIILQERNNLRMLEKEKEAKKKIVMEENNNKEEDGKKKEILFTEIQLTDPRRIETVVGHRMKVNEIVKTHFKANFKTCMNIQPRQKQELPTQLTALKEILLDDMDHKLDKVYEKHVIHFTIVEDSLILGLASVHTTVMDKTGSTIMASLYNMSDEKKKALVFGSTISIINPYLRVAALTGQTVIRVDDPQTVIFHTSGNDHSKCRFCFKSDPQFTCVKCKRAKYCDRECQVKDSKLLKHKLICDPACARFF